MPFQSKAQARFLFAKHPDIAKRWAAEYGVPKRLPGHVNPNSQSNENNSPTVAKQPRLPGVRRDFAMLSPPSHARFHPKSKAVPNQVEADKETGVTFMHEPERRHEELGKMRPHKGYHKRDVEVARRG